MNTPSHTAHIADYWAYATLRVRRLMDASRPITLAKARWTRSYHEHFAKWRTAYNACAEGIGELPTEVRRV